MEKSFLFVSSERGNAFFRDELFKSFTLLKSHNPGLSNGVKLHSLRIEASEDGIVNADVVFLDHDYSDKDENLFDIVTLDEKNNEIICDDCLLLANALHKFADGCETGKSLIHVIWCIESYAPNPSEVIEYYGALQRLLLWFNASLTIIIKDASIIEEWASALFFDTADSSVQVVTQGLSILWKGCLGLTIGDKDEPQLFPELSLTFEKKSFNPFKLPDSIYAEAVYVLPVAEIFSQVDIGTIHLTNIRHSSLCFFQVTNSCDENQRSALKELFGYLDNPGIGTLVRIRYACEPPNFDGLSSLKTDTWKQAVSDGHDGSISLYFKGYHRTATFLLIPEEILDGKAYAFLLQDSSDVGEDIMNIALEELSKKPAPEEPSRKEMIVNLLKDTPLFTNMHMVVLGKLLLRLPKEVKSHLEKKGQDAESLYDAIKSSLEVSANQEVFHQLIKIPFSKFELAPLQKVKPEYTAPMTTWPEYEALVEAEKTKKRSLARLSSGDFLGGLLPPPPSMDSIVYVDADQLLKLFTSEGNPSDEIKDKMVKFTHKRILHLKPTIPLESAKHAPWTEVLHLRHHGIHYNRNNKDEKFEMSCNRMRERFIRNEMASTCSSYQDKESSYVKLNAKSLKQEKPKVPEKKNRPHSKTQKVPSKVGRPKTTKSDEAAKPPAKRTSKYKSAVPPVVLRRSPRKKMSVNPKPSDLLNEPAAPRLSRSVSNAKKTPKPADLSELHKQKLRNAVLTALEKEGIGMKHEIFKLCFKKLFVLCKPFVLEIIGQGSTSSKMEKIAMNHVKQVIEFEKLLAAKR